MIKKFSAILPLIIFLVLISGVGYVVFQEPLGASGLTPTIISNPLLLTPTYTSQPTYTNTPTQTPTPTTTPTPSLTPTEIPPRVTISPTSTPTSTPTPTPTIIPTPLYPGIVTVTNLNVRWGPSPDYGYVDAIYEGDEVAILGRSSDGNWLKVETPGLRTGWIVAKYITTSVKIDSLSVLSTPPLPSTPIVLQETPQPLDFRRGIDIEGRSVSGTLDPYGEYWYTFLEENPETVIVFMFKPNVNSVDNIFVGYNIQFSLHDQNQIPVWPPGDADSLVIGAGQRPPSDRDGDLHSGELVWRGGPLVPNVRYYLRLVNKTPETIEYCLAPGDTYEWSCPQN